MSETVETILDKLRNARPEEVVGLLHEYQSRRYDDSWKDGPRLHRAFARRLVKVGQHGRAYDLARDGLESHANDPELLYLAALAQARGGNLAAAGQWLTALLDQRPGEVSLKVDALSLKGRLDKDRYTRTREPGAKAQLALQAAREYEAAHLQPPNSFPLINAATLYRLADRADLAHQLARQVLVEAQQELNEGKSSPAYWLEASLGEAHLLLGDLHQAAAWYRRAAGHASGQLGDIASMARNVRLLREKVQIPQALLDVFHPGTVVVAAGHMLDNPAKWAEQKLPPRFPRDPNLERRVGEAIAAKLDAMNAAVGYCSAACGTDLLFAEHVLRRNGELHLVLPFAKEDFYGTSVDYNRPDWREYRRRFDAVFEKAQIHYGTREKFLGDKQLFAFVGTFVQGLALMRAEELGTTARVLAVWDGDPRRLVGGTSYFLHRWKRAGHEDDVIDFKELRARAAPAPAPASAAVPAPAPAEPARSLRREVKVMLFADVKNYSKLQEEQIPTFFTFFLGEVAQVVQKSRNCPVLCNTWGDGLFLVFNDAVDAADFALRLLARVKKIDFTKVGLPADTTVRVGIHAGPVYPHWDQLLGRLNYFGSHVNRAARIEPVTLAGSVFVSEQFAAMLAVEPDHDYVCEYMGETELAKNYDRVPLYRLGRRWLDADAGEA